MQDELKLAFEKMSDAISNLEDGAGRAKDQLEQDGVIQTEYTYGKDPERYKG